MFGKPITLFKMFGFAVRIDLSWIIIAVLVTWSLAAGFFPMEYPGYERATYWWMGIGGMIGLFVSIIFHELCHSLVARQYGLPMKGITLFIFGGVAEMTEEPKSAKAELLMAIAGPAASVLVSILFYIAFLIGKNAGWPAPITGTLGYLSFINIILVIFNLLPGFPLDGGRVLRSILWAAKKDMHWATRVASSIGSGFGMLLIVLGVITFIGGNFIGGMWWFLIGMFLRSAAKMSYQQLIMRDALAGEPITKFMKRDVVTIRPDQTVEDLVDHYIYKYHYQMYPVVDHDNLVGCVSMQNVKTVPRTQWEQTRIEQIKQNCQEVNSIGPEEDAMTALNKMNQLQVTRLMVVKDGHLEGIVSLKDMLAFLSMKMELER